MTELTKLETLEKAVVDTEAAFDDDKAAFDYSFNKAAEDAAADAAYVIQSKEGAKGLPKGARQ